MGASQYGKTEVWTEKRSDEYGLKMVKPSHYEQWRFRHPEHSYWVNYGGGPHQQLLGPAMSVGTAPATTGGLNSFGIWSVEDRKKAWQDKQEKEKKEEKEEKEERKKKTGSQISAWSFWDHALSF